MKWARIFAFIIIILLYKIKIYQSKESETVDYPTRVTINITNSVINFKGEFKRERGYRGILFKDVVK